MKKIALPITIAAVALLATACGSSTPSASTTSATTTDTAASSPSASDSMPSVSGSLAWYTLQPPAASEKVISAFNAKYPDVKVETTAFQGPDIIDRVKAEAKGNLNKFDVIDMAGRNPLRALSAGGILAPYDPPALSEYPADLAKQISDKDAWAYGANAHGICYNSDEVSSPPTSYEDLLKPEYKGKIVYGAPIKTGFGQNFTVESKGVWGEQKWTDFWTGLGKQDVLIVDNPAGAMEQAVKGERPIVMYCNLSGLNRAAGTGAPIKWVTVEPNIANEVALAIAAKAPNAPAAEAFVNFMLSNDGQDVIADAFGLQPILPGAPQPKAAAGLDQATLILSPSEFAIKELNGLNEFDPKAYSSYVNFMTKIFG